MSVLDLARLIPLVAAEQRKRAAPGSALRPRPDEEEEPDPRAVAAASRLQPRFDPDGFPNLLRRSYDIPAPPTPRAFPNVPNYDPGDPNPLGVLAGALIGGLIKKDVRGGLATGGGYLNGYQNGRAKLHARAVDNYEHRFEEAKTGSVLDRQAYNDALDGVQAQMTADKNEDALTVDAWTKQQAAELAKRKQGAAELKNHTDAEHDISGERGAFYREMSGLSKAGQQARLHQAERDGDLERWGIEIEKDPETGAYKLDGLTKAPPMKAQDDPATIHREQLETELGEQYDLFRNPRTTEEGRDTTLRRIKEIQKALGIGDGSLTVTRILDNFTPAERESIAARRRAQDETERAHRVSEGQRAEGLQIQGRNATTAEKNAALRASGGAGSEAADMRAATKSLDRISADESSIIGKDGQLGGEPPIPNNLGVSLKTAHRDARRGVQIATDNGYLRGQFPTLRVVSGARRPDGRDVYFGLAGAGGNGQLHTRTTFHRLEGNLGKLYGKSAKATLEMPGTRGVDGKIVREPRVRVEFTSAPLAPPRSARSGPARVEVGGRTFTITPKQ